jgi:homoserine dehydrogenase
MLVVCWRTESDFTGNRAQPTRRLQNAGGFFFEHLFMARKSNGPTRVAIAGFGTVGRSVARLLQELAPPELRLTVILNRGIERKRVPWIDPGVRWTESIDEALSSDVDAFVELIGGRHPAESWISKALQAGKSVVTANKQVIAHRGPEFLADASRLGQHLRFEAAVAGGVPVVRAIEHGLAGDSLTRVSGILNGTCNYILSRMERDRLPFLEALTEAQALGLAEADPSQDIDGSDAQAKLAILAQIALAVHVRPGAIQIRGIDQIDAVDFLYARQMGCTIRQVAWAERTADPGLIRAAVGPALVPLDSPLARVRGSDNIVTLQGRFGGETTFGGRGAGGEPTAVAVVSDLLAIARNEVPFGLRAKVPHADVSPEGTSAYYVRFTVADRPGIIASLASAFARHSINIDAILQEPGFPIGRRPFVVSLEPAPVSSIERALNDLAAFEFHGEAPVALPVLSDEAVPTHVVSEAGRLLEPSR